MMWPVYVVMVIVLIFGLVVFRGAPYVPSQRKYVRRAFTKLYRVSKKDVLIDIGSGDGVVLRMAADQGARAIGYEINPILVVISRFLSRGNPLIQTRLADFWAVDLPLETTVVYVFGVSRDIEKIAHKIQQTTNRVGHPIRLMTYGAPVSSRTPVKTLYAHSLYQFEPLQPEET